jgi:hypothetical protein
MLDDDYALKLIRYELDLLRPPSEWQPGPAQIRVNGEFCNPFEVTARFSADLIASGMYPLSDEQVLMAYLCNGGLDADQAVRRKQCLSLNHNARQSLQSGNVEGLRCLLHAVNKHQVPH